MIRYTKEMLVCFVLLSAAEAGRAGPPPLPRRVGVSCIAVSPDGKLIAWGYADTGLEAQEGKVPLIHVFPLSGGPRKYALTGHKRWIDFLQFTRDGKYLLSGGMDGVVRTWDAQTGKLLRELALGKIDVRARALLPDEKQLLVWNYPPLPGPGETGVPFKIGEERGTFQVFDLAKGERLRSFERTSFTGFSLSGINFSRDGKLALLNCGLGWNGPGALEVLDVAKGQVVFTIDGRKERNSMNGCFDVEGKYVVVDEELGDARKKEKVTTNLALWDIAAKKRLRKFDQRKTSARAVKIALTPDSKRVLTVDSDKMVRLWDIATGKEVWSATINREEWMLVPWSGQGHAPPSFLADGERVVLIFVPVIPPAPPGRRLGPPPPPADGWHICVYELASGKLLRETRCKPPEAGQAKMECVEITDTLRRKP